MRLSVSTIFPGMDPYLEAPGFWQGIHDALIVYARDYLQPLVRPRFVASIGHRVYLDMPERHIVPDVTVRRAPRGRTQPNPKAVLQMDEPIVVRAQPTEVSEPLIEILDLEDSQRIVTVIEIVSPTNKRPGPGRHSYRTKQREVLSSTANLVEIDLLRKGRHTVAVPLTLANDAQHFDYLVCVNRAQGKRDLFDLYPRRLPECLPRIRVPLTGQHPDVRLDLQAVLCHAYDAACYRDVVNYSRPCRPRLSPEDQAWANELICQAGLHTD
jgi:hypothetical protein